MNTRQIERFLAKLIVVTGVVALPLAPSVRGQENQCVSCHFARLAATDPSRPSDDAHLDEWETSPHSQANVGCESCHGGDPETSDVIAAHRQVLSSANPASRVHVRNIPDTCGSCHEGQRDAYGASRHAALLLGGDRRAPTCITCHGPAAARLPSTRGLTSRCAMCHGPEGVAPMSEHEELVRLMRERIQEHRYSLALIQTVIENTGDADRRRVLERQYEEAVAPLTAAVAAWHAFDFDRAAEPLARAGTRIDELVDDLTVR